MGVVFLVIFILVPWQVAFLGCWLIHFYTCAASLAELALVQTHSPSGAEAVPLVRLPSESNPGTDSPSSERPEEEPSLQRSPDRLYELQTVNAHLHLLLFMTWLLPLVAPVLAVWVRTLATAGLTTPFDGDHNFLYVAPFLVLVEALSGSDADQYAKALL